MKKSSLNKRLQLCINFTWVGAVIALLSRFLGSWCLWLGLAILVVATICRLTLIRCPYCGHRLTEGQRIPPCCPSCGGELEQ